MLLGGGLAKEYSSYAFINVDNFLRSQYNPTRFPHLYIFYQNFSPRFFFTGIFFTAMFLPLFFFRVFFPYFFHRNFVPPRVLRRHRRVGELLGDEWDIGDLRYSVGRRRRAGGERSRGAGREGRGGRKRLEASASRVETRDGVKYYLSNTNRFISRRPNTNTTNFRLSNTNGTNFRLTNINFKTFNLFCNFHPMIMLLTID